MKSQIIFKNNKNHKDEHNNGFLIFEIMIAFLLASISIITFITLSNSSKLLKIRAVSVLENLKKDIQDFDNLVKNNSLLENSEYFESPYGNFGYIYRYKDFSLLKTNYEDAISGDNCYPRFHNTFLSNKMYSSNILLPTTNIPTSFVVRNGFIYLSTDSPQISLSDFYIVDSSNLNNINILSNIDTGPGIKDIALNSHYIYALNAGTTNTLQIIDIEDRKYPKIIKKYKLPTPNASTTAPIGSSVFYYNDKVFIGTEKWSGNELNIIDVSNPLSPQYINGFEMNTLIEDIYVYKDFVYIASPSIKQFRTLDIKDIYNIKEIYSFSPSGHESQEAKTIDLFENIISLGRTSGGFNIVKNHELFSFYDNFINDFKDIYKSLDIKGGVYGMVRRYPYIYVVTNIQDHQFQIYDFNLEKVEDFSLDFTPLGMVCDREDIYVLTDNESAFIVLKSEKHE